MKQIHRKHILPLCLVLAVMVILGTLILGLTSGIQKKMEVSATSNVKGTVQLIADSITSFRSSHIAAIFHMGNTIHMDDNLELILEQARQDEMFSWAAVADAGSGRGICHDGSDFRISDLNCEQTALQGQRSVSGAHINSQGTWAVTVQTPIYENGLLTGALYADISMEHLGEILPMSIYNGNGSLYILDISSHRFIFHPYNTGTYISTKYDLEGFLSDFTEVNDNLEQEIYQAIDRGQKQIVQIRFNNDSSYLFFWPVEESDWYLCGIVPETSIQQESAAVSHTIALVVIISFAAASFILCLIYWDNRRAVLAERKEEQYRIALFRGISASINEVVLMYDCSTKKREIAFDNIERILGVSADEFENQISPDEFHMRFAGAEFDKISKQGDNTTVEDTLQRVVWHNPKTNQKQFLRMDILHSDLLGESKCIISIDDFTTEVTLQDSLRTAAMTAQNANRVKSDFLSSMSHEIRTPLNAVNGMLQIARTRLADGKDPTDCLDKAEGASRQLLSLISDILDISKIESGKMMLEEQWFRLDEMLKSVCDTAGVRAEQKHQQFEVDISACDGLEVLGDSVRLSQVLMNLLNNAFKYTQEKGHILFRIHQEYTQARDKCQFTFTISDNGIGMSEEFQKRVFLPFERESASISRKEGGTGLGLSIVNNYVSLMGGFLKLESRKGEGSTFDVTLSFRCNERSNAGEPATLEEPHADFTGVRVLLAEDNELNREIALEFLHMAHAEVVCAENGKEAFELFQKFPEGYFKLILMDMQMPVWDGLEATRKIRALPGEYAGTVLIIASTANAFLEDEKKCLAAGMNDYISKPMDMDKLYKKMVKYLEG